MDLVSALGDISLWQLALVAGVAMFASIVGGLSGYGSGALMPLVLVPIVGAAPVVPIISISGLFSNASRAFAFRPYVDRRRTLIILASATPPCVFGAYVYTLLTNRGALIVIGLMLALSVPLRRLMTRRQIVLGDLGLACGGFVYGVLVGGTVGAGVILLSVLLMSGLKGPAVIATDAAISIVLGVVKLSVFVAAGAMTPQVIALGLLIGLVALPGAFVARALVERMPVHIHTAMIDAVVIVGGAVMMYHAVRL
jgi:uncharacterized membrane protein YfcA